MSQTLSSNESIPSARKKIIVLGSGPNRIGQGIEFDYCCVHGLLAIKECGYEAIMINCNPETVSLTLTWLISFILNLCTGSICGRLLSWRSLKVIVQLAARPRLNWQKDCK